MDATIDVKSSMLPIQGTTPTTTMNNWPANNGAGNTAGVPFLNSRPHHVSATVPAWNKSVNAQIDHRGPSPEKGSGQERFRQVLFTPTNNPSETKNSKEPKCDYNALVSTRSPPLIQGSSHYSPDYTTTRRPSLGAQTPVPEKRLSVQPTFRDRANSTSANGQTGSGHAAAKDNDRRGGRGGHGGDHFKTHTAVLSAECQKRRFNPQFKEWSVKGHHFCSVDLKGLVLKLDRGYPTAHEAKQELARRAVEEIRRRPCSHPAPAAAIKAVQAQKSLDANQYKKEMSCARSMDPARKMAPAQLRQALTGQSAKPSDMESSWVEQKDMSSSSAGQQETTLSPYILADPIASKAFLEGFSLGARLYETANRLKTENMPLNGISGARVDTRTRLERDRSPTIESSRRIRERSPLRNNRDN